MKECYFSWIGKLLQRYHAYMQNSSLSNATDPLTNLISKTVQFTNNTFIGWSPSVDQHDIGKVVGPQIISIKTIVMTMKEQMEH